MRRHAVCGGMLPAGGNAGGCGGREQSETGAAVSEDGRCGESGVFRSEILAEEEVRD